MSRRYGSSVLDMLRDYRRIARKVKEIVKKFDSRARVFVFGSVVRGKFTATSDIDILVITEKIDMKYEIMTEVYKSIDAPIELHIITQKQLNNWYLRFIDPQELEEI